MIIDWTNILLALIAAINIGGIIKILSIAQGLHNKEIEALKALNYVEEKKSNLLQKQLDIQKDNYEMRMSQKDEIVGHYQNMLKADLREKIKNAGIVVDVINPQSNVLDNDVAAGIREIIDHIENLENAQFLPDAETSIHLFEYYYFKHEYIRAAKMLERAISLGEVSAENYFNLGVTYNNGGNFSKAIEEYDKAVELQTNNAMYWSYHGSVLKKLGRLAEAEVSLNRAVDLDQNCDDAHYNLAAVYAMQGKVEECIKHLKKAIQINPFWKTYAPKRPYFKKVLYNPKFLAVVKT